MTHACINSLSQILVNEEVWLSIVSKILIISLAIMDCKKEVCNSKGRKIEQIYFKTISRYLVCTDCPPCYLSSRASYPLVFPRWGVVWGPHYCLS